MNPNLVLVLVVGVLFATGVTLLLERSLSRVLLGVILLGNGANVLILAAGRPGGAPILGVSPAGEISDPLPQAMVLTAIVITLGMTAFVLAMAYRSWQLTGHDEVRADPEDRRIVRRAARGEPAAPEDNLGTGVSPWTEPTDGVEGVDPEQVDPEPRPRRFDGGASSGGSGGGMSRRSGGPDGAG